MHRSSVGLLLVIVLLAGFTAGIGVRPANRLEFDGRPAGRYRNGARVLSSAQ